MSFSPPKVLHRGGVTIVTPPKVLHESIAQGGGGVTIVTPPKVLHRGGG